MFRQEIKIFRLIDLQQYIRSVGGRCDFDIKRLNSETRTQKTNLIIQAGSHVQGKKELNFIKHKLMRNQGKEMQGK